MQNNTRTVVALVAYFDVEKETLAEATLRATKGMKFTDRLIMAGGVRHLLKRYKRPLEANFYKIEQIIPRNPLGTVRTKITPLT